VSDDHVRLFAALELPEMVRGALVQWGAEQVGEQAGLRFTSSESLHLTLCFLGSVPASAVDAIAGACRSVAGFARLALGLGQAVWLPSPRHPRVLAVDLEDARGGSAGGPPGGLGHLQAALAAALAAGGWYESETRPFRPHVTVARVRRGARVPGVELPRPVPVQFVGSEVLLLRSRLGGSHGARYERLARVTLA
jgi:RNA 2',3'-cyclic 3'-phosphodiesterase